MYRSGLVSTSLLWILMLGWMPAGARSSPADPVNSADVEQLKERVSEYFNAVHSRQFAKAKQFILPRSRDMAGAARPGRTRVAGFSILEVKLEEGNRSAVVTIRREIMAAGLAGQARIKEKFRWKKEEGKWFLDPADPPRTTAEIFRDYYYAKRIARANPKPGQELPAAFGGASRKRSLILAWPSRGMSSGLVLRFATWGRQPSSLKKSTARNGSSTGPEVVLSPPEPPERSKWS